MKPFSLVGTLLLIGCSAEAIDPNPVVSVARICQNGSHIFKYRDGSYHTAMGHVVEDIDKVCQ